MPTGKQALLHALLIELAAESADIGTGVPPLDDFGWSVPTPGAGWDVRDTSSTWPPWTGTRWSP